MIGVPNDVPALSRGAGRNITGEESLTSRTQNWERTLFARKADVDWAYCLGVNKIIFHLWCFQPDSQVKPSYCEHGTGINRNLTWWDQAHGFISYMTRCQYLLRQGVHVSDVDFVERKEGEFVHNIFQEEFPAKYRYDITHWEGVVTRMSVQNGMIVTPEGYAYSLLVLPSGDSISVPAMRKIKELVEAGANVLGQPRGRERGYADHANADAEIASISHELWGDNPGPQGQQTVGKGRIFWGETVDQVLAALDVRPDFHCNIDPGGPGIDWNHRRAGNSDIYFVVNRAPLAVAFDAFFRVTGKAPELWDPDSGRKTRTLLYEEANGETRVPLRLAPFESTFVIFRSPPAGHFIAVDSSTPGGAPLSAGDVALSEQGAVLRPGQPGDYQLTDTTGRKTTVQVSSPPSGIDLPGPWQVRFAGQGAPDLVTFDKLTAWTDNANERIKYYSGPATYSCHFTMPASGVSGSPRWTLDLGDVRDLADVKVNGRMLGTVWREPFQVDVSSAVRPGDNLLEVTVVDSWLNRYLGDLNLPPKLRICTIGLHSTEAYTADFPLPVSGLLGPVKLSSPPLAVIPVR